MTHRTHSPRWLEQLRELSEVGEPAVLVTVAAARGSTPRAAGTKMVVTGDDFFETIGGGHLEYCCLEIAREMLAGKANGRRRRFERFPLGPALGQCCGGSANVLFEAIAVEDLAGLTTQSGSSVLVTPIDADDGSMHLRSSKPGDQGASPCILEEGGRKLLIEPFTDERTPLYLFGAGHVGQAMVAALAPLPFRVTWIDSRPEIFPEQRPANVAIETLDLRKTEVTSAEPGAFYLVMTHSHQLDLEICEAVLRRGDSAYLGLIGSATKRTRFERRLFARGLPKDCLKRLTCPIGIAGISGKHPAEIAASVAAQLLVVREVQASAEVDAGSEFGVQSR